LAELKHWFKTT